MPTKTSKIKAKAKTKAKVTKPAKKVTAVVAKKKITVTSPFTKSQVLNYLSEYADLKKTDVSKVISGLTDLMEAHLSGKKGPGEFVIPGLMKCRVIRKPATKARKGINPFTGEQTTFQAKPARNVVKIRPLKKLKDMVQ